MQSNGSPVRDGNVEPDTPEAEASSAREEVSPAGAGVETGAAAEAEERVEVAMEEEVAQAPPASDASPETSADTPLEMPEEIADALRRELDEALAALEGEREAALRARAEVENVRRRAARDVEQAHRFGVEGLVTELLPVIDSLELGLRAAREEGAAGEALAEGTEMTLRMLTGALEKFGVAEVNPEREPFNPEFHEAMSMQEDPEAGPGVVLQVFQKGFVLNGRVVRPAMVIVSK